MMLTIETIDVCSMLNCFWFEKFCLHYALCDFDSILLHYAKLFIRQSIDRKQIFDVTFENPSLKNPAYATEQDNANITLINIGLYAMCILKMRKNEVCKDAVQQFKRRPNRKLANE